jgi:hypothetical protein
MRHEPIDYLTIAGLAIFLILGIVYISWDYITVVHIDLGQPISSVTGSLPAIGIPNFNMDWFDSMDAASKIIFCFIMTTLVATLIGGTGVYLLHRRRFGAGK